MALDVTRRGVLIGGCGFAALLAVPFDAEAALMRGAPPAPRHRCPHRGCRHYRPEGEGAEDGTCAMSVHGVVPTIEVP